MGQIKLWNTLDPVAGYLRVLPHPPADLQQLNPGPRGSCTQKSQDIAPPTKWASTSPRAPWDPGPPSPPPKPPSTACHQFWVPCSKRTQALVLPDSRSAPALGSGYTPDGGHQPQDHLGLNPAHQQVDTISGIPWDPHPAAPRHNPTPSGLTLALWPPGPAARDPTTQLCPPVSQY